MAIPMKYPQGIVLSKVLITFFFIAGLAFAEMETFEEEYTYQASEYDSKVSCRTLAMEQVKRLLLERLGTYLESETQVRYFQLTKDQIMTLTAGIVRSEILDEKWDGKTYYLKARIAADPQDMARTLEILRQDRQKLKELEESRKKADEALKEVELLKGEQGIAKGGKTVQGQYGRAVNRLSSIDWFNEGYALGIAGRYQEARVAFTRAIELNPQYAEAYYNRGTAFFNLGSYQQAIIDYGRAVELNPKKTEAYFNRGIAYRKLGHHQQAIRDFRTAARLGDGRAQDYLRSIGIRW